MLSSHVPERNKYEVGLSNALAITKPSKLPLDIAMLSPYKIKQSKHNSPVLWLLCDNKPEVGYHKRAARKQALFRQPIPLLGGQRQTSANVRTKHFPHWSKPLHSPQSPSSLVEEAILPTWRLRNNTTQFQS